MMIIQDMHILSVAKRIIKMHCTATDHTEYLLKSMCHKKISNIIRYFLFHHIIPYYLLYDFQPIALWIPAKTTFTTIRHIMNLSELLSSISKYCRYCFLNIRHTEAQMHNPIITYFSLRLCL